MNIPVPQTCRKVSKIALTLAKPRMFERTSQPPMNKRGQVLRTSLRWEVMGK